MLRSLFRFLWLSIAAAAITWLIGCSSAPTPTIVPSPTSVVLPTPVPSAMLTDTPTAAPALAPTQTPTATPTVKTTPTRTPTLAAGTMRIKLFFVALEDNGKRGKKIGCNDSIVAVDRVIPATTAPLTAALKELFSISERTYGPSGLYNALAQANLKLDSAAVVNGKATVNISGVLKLGGVCDNPRAEAQIKELVMQFATVKQANIFINNIPIEKALSEK
jgi:hypothetical protein